MFTQPENGRLCHCRTGARFTQRTFTHVWVSSQQLYYILIKLICSLLFSTPVSRNFKHSLLSGLGLSVFSCSFHWPAVNLSTGWRRVDFCQRAVICCVSDIVCEVLHLFPRCHTWHGSSSISGPKWYYAVTMVIRNLNYESYVFPYVK